MATKENKKAAIRRAIIESAEVYSQNLAGKTFLYVYGEKINDFFLPMSLRVEKSSIEKSQEAVLADFIFSKDASVGKYERLLVKDANKTIPQNVQPLLNEKFIDNTDGCERYETKKEACP